MRKAIAVFDIDGTVLKNTSAERIFVRYLLSRGELDPLDMVNFALHFLSNLFSDRVRAIKGNKSYLKGKNVRRIDELAEECFREKIEPRISEWALEQIDRHRREGLEIVLLSGTLDILLSRFKGFLHVDKAHGCALSVSSGCYTGDILGVFPYGRAKAEIMLASYDSESYDLSLSYAYGNHLSDLHFLRLFGHPVLVNPDSRTLDRTKNHAIEKIYY